MAAPKFSARGPSGPGDSTDPHVVAVPKVVPPAAVCQLHLPGRAPAQLEQRSLLGDVEAPEIVSEPTTSPVRTDAPVTVTWASCCAADQYIGANCFRSAPAR